uniref:AlNc14C344G10829 protein n=1 Tax=Albugo laibachii Nc14 TaxID=890382 RepID=F0WX71_9STRA|nr:AlNc14C344G10829 [Albugo laibachii Nc14]|eukprot:CCA26062.1 AlNc14C344G10829 [Albugo laibachii Nc14]
MLCVLDDQNRIIRHPFMTSIQSREENLIQISMKNHSADHVEIRIDRLHTRETRHLKRSLPI